MKLPSLFARGPGNLRPRHGFLRRLYRMGLGLGLLASLPLTALAAWHLWTAYLQLERAQKATGEAVPIDSELLQLELHDLLSRARDRALSPKGSGGSHLRTVELYLPRESLDAVMTVGAGKESDFVSGSLEEGDEVLPVEVRRRGTRPWNWLGAQKSLRIRTERGDLYRGARTFNLINDAAPFGLWPYVALAVGREQGLLTPDAEPVRLRLNNVDYGVFRYEVQPDESVLREHSRLPGSIFAGECEGPDACASPLGVFASTTHWKKVAWIADAEREDYAPLKELLQNTRNATQAQFAEYARANIAVDRYAQFDALDVVFGGEEHDYFGNHKLYLDPFTGKFEPVLWGFDQFSHEPAQNYVDHPLLARLKLTPGYLAQRNRTVFDLLTAAASVTAVEARIERQVHELAPELESDPFWDAYKLLPSVSRLHRTLLRPMDLEKWQQVTRSELAAYARRSRYLLSELERLDVTSRMERLDGRSARVTFTVGGENEAVLRALIVRGECNGEFELHADLDGDGRIDRTRDALVGRGHFARHEEIASPYARLAPGLLVVARQDKPRRGPIRLVSEPRQYSYVLRGKSCAPHEAAVVLENLSTGARTELTVGETGGTATGAPPRSSLPELSAPVRLAPGERSAHLWSYPADTRAGLTTLGPGPVRVTATREFAASETVRILPGTRLELAAGASLVFDGPVFAEGTSEQPISIVSANDAHPFGTVVLRQGSDGSRLAHVRFQGGRGARLGNLDAPATLNIYSTSAVSLVAVELDGSQASNALHAAYAKDLRLVDVTIRDAKGDALDLDFSRVVAERLSILRDNDDCVDIMGTVLRVANSVIVGCTNYGIVAGEESHVTGHDVLVAQAKIGLLAKNNSHAELSRLVLYADKTGLETRRHEIRYAGESRIEATDVYAVACARLSRHAQGTHLRTAGVTHAWPSLLTLVHLREGMLGLASWQELARLSPPSSRAGGLP